MRPTSFGFVGPQRSMIAVTPARRTQIRVRLAGRGVAADDAGFATVQFVAATALSLVLFVLVANLVLVQYARAGIRAAATEGAAAGSRATEVGAAMSRCRARADDALDDLLGGGLLTSRGVACRVGADRVQVDVTGVVAAWLPLYPAFDVDATATVVREVAP